MIKKFLSWILGSTILKNFLSLSIAEFISRLLSVITFAYLARVLSPQGFGILGFASAFVFYFILLVNFGLDTYGTREVANRSYQQSKFVNAVISARLIIAVPLFIVLIFIAVLLNQNYITKAALIISGINLFSNAISVDWFFQGTQKMKPVAARQIGVSILNFVLIIGLVHSQNDVLIAVSITGLSLLLNSSLLLTYYSKKVDKISIVLEKKLVKKIFVEAAPIGLSSLMIAVYYNLDIVMLGYMKSDYEVGIYNAAVKIFLLGNILYGLILKSFFPSLSSSVNSGKEVINATFKKYFLSMLPAGLITAFVMYALSSLIIDVLYGSSYNSSVSILKILSMNSLIVCINMIFGNPLLAWGKQKEYLFVVATGALANIALNILFIPRYSYIGAGIATLLSETTVFISLFLVYNSLLKVKNAL